MNKNYVSSHIVFALSVVMVAGCSASPNEHVDETGIDETWEEGGETGVSATMIGPAGGTLALDDGFQLLIPEGALQEATRIAVHRLADIPRFALGPVYRVEPVGLKLFQPIEVTLPLFDVELPPNTNMLLHGYAAKTEGGDYHVVSTVTKPDVSTETKPDAPVTIDVSELGFFTSGSPLPHVIASGERYPRRIASDATHVYWSSGGNAQYQLAYGNDGLVLRAPLGGGLVEVLTAPQPDPVGVAVNDQYVYWVNAGDGALWQGEGTGGAVMRMPKGGGAPEKLSDEGFPQDIALDDTHVFWTDAYVDEIRKMPLDGGDVTILATNQGDPRYMTLTDSDVFYTTGDMGVVAKVSKMGGTPVVLSSEGGKTTGITVHEGYVYWTNEVNGAVRRVSVSGGTPITLRTSTRPTDVVVHEGQLFFTDFIESSLYSVPLTGGTATALAMDHAQPWDLHFHASTKQLIFAAAGNYNFEGELIRIGLP